MEITSNVTDTALVFEGGGMRGAFTAGVVVTLLKAGIYFDYVSGISAGASNTVNYISRASDRARQCFVDFALDPLIGSWRTWLQGKGMFNAHYIYEETWLPGGPLPFDFPAFMANPARFRIGAFDVDAGETIYWSRDDIHVAGDLMRRVRASSSIPFAMPMVRIDNRTFVDGALGTGGGIPLSVAQSEGYTKFFVVLTRPRSYVKPTAKGDRALKAYYWRYPAVAEGILGRADKYNATREELLDLERDGKACVVFPDEMRVTNRTTDIAALQSCYDGSLMQSRRELPRWREFLGLD